MKRRFSAAFVACILMLAVGCEKLPEEAEPTSTPTQAASEQKDYYTSSQNQEAGSPSAQGAEEQGEPDETQTAKGGSSSLSGRGSSGASISEYINPNITVRGKDPISGDSFGIGWRPLRIRPVAVEPPAVWVPKPIPEPEPTPEPRPTVITYLNGTRLKNNAFINDGGFPMVPLKPVITALNGSVTPDGASYIISVGGSYIYIDPSLDTLVFNGKKYTMGTSPEIVEGFVYLTLGTYIDLFKATYSYDSNNLRIQISPSVASPTSK